MKMWLRPAVAVVIAVSAVITGQTDVSACCFPFMSGYWGAGYGGGYGYGYGAPAPMYTASYAAWRPVWAAPTSFYGASYAAANACCAPACCDPCGGCCASGSCAGGSCADGSCAGSGAGSLKPSADENFRGKSEDADTDEGRTFPEPRTPADSYERDRDRDPLDGFSSPARSQDAAPAQDDAWSGSGSRSAPARTNEPAPAGRGLDRPATNAPAAAPGSDAAPDDGLFPADPLGDFGSQRSNKPPMSDPLDGISPAAPADSGVPDLKPVDEGAAPGTGTGTDDFLSPGTEPAADAPMLNPSARRERLNRVYGSQLREVVPSPRLAGRSLKPTLPQMAGGDSLPAKLRWISVPARPGHAQL